MLISDLHERLRLVIAERIEARETTGTELARRAGFQQAHISNYLNRRRGLSIESMDRLMEVLELRVRDLMPRDRQAGAVSDAGFEAVPVAQPAVLLQSDFSTGDVAEHLRFKKTFLRRIRAEMASQRSNWHRWVMYRADRESCEAMRPRLLPGSMLLIDRHYNSLRSYRKREPNLYLVKNGDVCLVRYVELQGNQLTLRPENQRCELDYVELAKGRTFADYVVGRVAHIAIET